MLNTAIALSALVSEMLLISEGYSKREKYSLFRWKVILLTHSSIEDCYKSQNELILGYFITGVYLL